MDLTDPFVLGALGALVAMAAVKLLQNIWKKYVFDHRNAKVAGYIRSVQQKIKDDQRKASYSLPIPKGWYKVCRSDEIKPGQVKEYTICESILAVYRSEDGKTVGVLDADCPHLGANMAIEGKVVGDCLQCPFHLIEFGADGACSKVPWTKSVPPQLKAKSWHVKEYLGFVMIWYDSEKNPPSFDLPESISEQISNMYFVTHKGPYAVKMHIQEFAENSADFQHFGAIHNQMQIPFTTRRLPFITLKHNVDWKIGQGDNSHILNFYDTAWLKLLGKEFPSTKATATITMIGPAALAVFEFDVPKVGRAIVVMAHTPIDSLCMNVEFYAYAEKSVSRVMAWYLLGNWIAQWKNDISIWENKLYLHKPNVLQGDGPVKKLRRWFLQFYPKNYASRSIDCEIDS